MLISKKISEYVGQNKNEFLKILGDVVNFESHSYGNKEIKNKCGDYLKLLFESIGFEMEKIDVEDIGFHLRGKKGNSENKVLLVGHYDTVFPTGTTKERPFSIKDNKAYGPGIFDMKGGIVSYYMAIKALIELNLLSEDKEIDIFLNCDEEAGSGTSKDSIIELAKKARACLVAEPGHIGEGYVTAERFGRSVVKVTANGVAGHAGNRPEYTANPLIELSQQLLKIDALCEVEKGLYYSAVSMHGGDFGATAMTPESAYLILDIRYKNDEMGKKVADAIVALTSINKQIQLEISGGVEKPPFEQNENNAVVYNRAKEIVEEMGYIFAPKKLGGGSDGNFTAFSGCATLDGLGLNGEFLHNPKEYILIDTIPQRVALLAELIRTL